MSRLPIPLTSLFLGLLLLGACSDRAAKSDAGAVWPDLSRKDQAVTPDLTPDLKPPDKHLPPDHAPIKPDLPPPPTWKKDLTAKVALHAVACFKGHVYAVGQKGTILHRGPTATSFTNQTASTTAELFTVAFGEDSKGQTYGVTAGKDYAIWQTMDLGKKWGQAPQCSAYIFDTFYALHLHNYDRGLGAGVAANNQGGGSKYYDGSVSYSWVCSSPTYLGETFYDIFSRAKRGWMVGDTKGKIYLTVDGGVTWTTTKISTNYALRGVDFPTPSLGVAVGEFGTILRSTDGQGKTWKAVKVPTTAHLWDVSFYSATLGWAVGDKGTILHTKDGGVTWKLQPSGVTDRLESVCLNSATDGWAVGQGGVMLHTTTGGL